MNQTHDSRKGCYPTIERDNGGSEIPPECLGLVSGKIYRINYSKPLPVYEDRKGNSGEVTEVKGKLTRDMQFLKEAELKMWGQDGEYKRFRKRRVPFKFWDQDKLCHIST